MRPTDIPDKPAGVIWIRKRPEGSGGDEVYDNRISELLARSRHLRTLEVERTGRAGQLKALLSGVPHNRYKYPSAQAALMQLPNQEACDLVISWEALEASAAKLRRPATMIVHNVMSDLAPQIFPYSVLGQVARIWSKRWEKKLYSQSNLTIIALSRADAKLIKALAPSGRVAVASPGAPASVPLLQSRIVAELVLSGTYMWYPKRRDLHRFEEEYVFGSQVLPVRLDCSLPPRRERSLLREMSSGINHSEYANGLRFGIITDRFTGGFKLKALSFIAQNCIVLSYTNLADEFSHIPDSHLFVRCVRDIHEIEDIVTRLSKRDSAEIASRWDTFKAACLAHFSWERAAEAIQSTFGSEEDNGGI